MDLKSIAENMKVARKKICNFSLNGKHSIPKYLLQIIGSIIVSLILFICIFYYTGNIVASISVITLVLVVISFIIGRYENRTDAIVDLKFIEKDKFHFFEVSIVNTGGKTIYLDKCGVKTKNGIIIDFDEEPPYDLPPKPKKPANKNPTLNNLSYTLDLPVTEIVMPKIKPFMASIVNPGNAQNDRKELWEVLELIGDKIILNKKNLVGEVLELKGFVTDQLHNEYESEEWIQFNSQMLTELAQQDIQNKD
ncbi:hypothetical protein [Methanoregula sp. UBA64]|jgi:hypothetical protein|uniref:hypothetical protein n=1 Tax=Methanoregula sp. UBA64 TaxID=1915554 RepID=UPI0025E4F2F2|nr:hypothetical protein [Methanoregula sp. UBA64]